MKLRYAIAVLIGMVPVSAQATALLTGLTPVVSSGPAATLVAKASPGTALAVVATNLTSTAGFLVGYNSASVPVDGALTPALVIDCVVLPAGGTASINDQPGPGTNYTAGVVYIVTSASSCYTKTTGTLLAFLKAKVQ